LSTGIGKQPNPNKKWLALGERLKRARESSGLTQEATAEHLGVSSHAVSMWETGTTRPDQSRLPQIAALYGVSTDHLLTGTRQIADRQAPYDVTSRRAVISREINEIIDAAEQQLTATELGRIRDLLRFVVQQNLIERTSAGADKGMGQ
jgi:transcriptional regulator with XRE-family HTH domain